jgi:hypothetical protein
MHDEDLDEVAALRRQLADTEQRLAAMQDRLTSRRNLLRLGGAAAMGAAAAVVGSPGSAAAATGAMQFGAVNNAGNDLTELRSSDQLFAFRVSNSSLFGNALEARSSGATGLDVIAEPGNSARGVVTQINGQEGYALMVNGGRSQVYFAQGFDAGPALLGNHNAGELAANDDDLWYCVDSGSPGTWRKLASVETAGAFHPIATARVYDSRWTGIILNVIKGPLVVGASSRLVYCDDKRALATGLVTVNDLVPAGATAIAYNLTVTGMTGRGFLAVEPGGTADYGGSAINWSPGPTALANASVVKLDASRRVSVFVGGDPGSSTHFIIDVVGYYR